MITSETFPGESDLEIQAKAYGHVLGLDISLNGRTHLRNMTLETAHALADWIIANVPKPEPKTAWDHWLDFEVGQVFTIGRSGNNYRKVSATEAVYLADTETYNIDPEMKNIWSAQGYDFLSEVVIPLPTKFAAVVKSEGVLWTLADWKSDYSKWINTSGDWLHNPEDLVDAGFEVIYEGIEA